MVIISIFGGGDSALDWAVELSKDSKVNLIHRRDDFRGAHATVEKVYKLARLPAACFGCCYVLVL